MQTSPNRNIFTKISPNPKNENIQAVLNRRKGISERDSSHAWACPRFNWACYESLGEKRFKQSGQSHNPPPVVVYRAVDKPEHTDLIIFTGSYRNNTRMQNEFIFRTISVPQQLAMLRRWSLLYSSVTRCVNASITHANVNSSPNIVIFFTTFTDRKKYLKMSSGCVYNEWMDENYFGFFSTWLNVRWKKNIRNTRAVGFKLRENFQYCSVLLNDRWARERELNYLFSHRCSLEGTWTR